MRRRKHVEVPDDTGEAQAIRAEAERELRELKAQAPAIRRATDLLIERRRQNHFGRDLTVTFRPRGGRA